jgi:hypothetical protein
VVEVDFATVRAGDVAAKPEVMQRQRTLLADRYDLSDRPATGVMMSGGRKAVQQGVRVKLPAGVTWEQLAAMSPDEIRAKDLFPRGFLPLPHVKHETGGMVFPDFEIQEIDYAEVLRERAGGELVFTKCGRPWYGRQGDEPTYDLRPETIRFELEQSLKRLGTDHVDLYQFHWPDTETGTPVEDSWAAMAELVAEGKVRWAGVSNFDLELLERCERVRHVDSLQPPYSLLDRAADGIVQAGVPLRHRRTRGARWLRGRQRLLASTPPG